MLLHKHKENFLIIPEYTHDNDITPQKQKYHLMKLLVQYRFFCTLLIVY